MDEFQFYFTLENQQFSLQIQLMTEYSKNSKNMKAQTVSNTGGNSGQGPTHPYSGHTDSPQHYSQGNSLQSDIPESPEDVFDIAIQYIMPLVKTIKQQNEHLKHQRDQIQTEMVQLHKLSQNLLSQNQQLRRHHSLRTQDIKKLIETISINTNEQVGDINHQSFLLRQSNHALVKKIQSEMKASNEIQQAIIKKDQQLKLIYHQSNINQQAHRDLQIKNKQMFYRCEELKKQIQSFNSLKDNQQVQQILIEVVNLKNKNKQDVVKARDLLYDHNEEKPFIEQNYVNVSAQNKQLKAEEQQLRNTARATEKKLQEAKISYGQSIQRFTESFRNYQKSKNRLNESQEQLIKIKQNLLNSRVDLKNNQPQIAQMAQVKENLKQKILAKRQILRKIQEQRLQAQQKQQKQLKLQVNKLKQELSTHTIQINQQISRRITPQTAIITNGLAQAKQEYAELCQEVQELRQSVRKLQNPRKQIIRLEYQLKKLNYKKA